MCRMNNTLYTETDNEWCKNISCMNGMLFFILPHSDKHKFCSVVWIWLAGACYYALVLLCYSVKSDTLYNDVMFKDIFIT
jgi:hypothetical protein